MKSDQALKPIFNSIPSFVKDQGIVTAKEEATDEERRLFAMARTAGWKTFVEFTENVVKEIEEVNKQAIGNGASFEEIGRNTIVISMTQDIIRKLLNKVEDAVEACEHDGSK